ncbi:hypothetical protein MMC13_000441 [Lambiella insularis]|nr:hypothetical protein [Lambiella insularis]
MPRPTAVFIYVRKCLPIIAVIAGSFSIWCLLYTRCEENFQRPAPVSLLDASIEELGQLLQKRTITSAELVDVYLERISEVNGRLHAVNDINPDARSIAQELDRERALGRLHEATIITKLRKAGAIILGWSAYGGQCRGAYRDNQDPGGSSSGSAVAVSIGLAAAALGTETMGSIIIPSEWNNIVGIKPTLGLVSRHMVITKTPRQDVVGPMARTVKDAAQLLVTIAGKDPKDNYTMTQPFDTPPDYVKALDLKGLEGARTGIPWNGVLSEIYRPQSPEHLDVIMKAFNESIFLLKSAGATVIPTTFHCFEDPAIKKPWRDSYTGVYQNADSIPSVDSYIRNLDPGSTPIRNFSDVVKCTIHDPREQYPTRDISQWEGAQASKDSPSSAVVWEAYQHVYHQAGAQGVFGALEEDNLDALVLPSCISSALPAYAGSPVVTVPMGTFGDDVTTVWWKKDDPQMRSVIAGPGMAFGLSFLGAKWSEEKLLGLAYAYEQRTMVRRKVKPKVVPVAELKGKTWASKSWRHSVS